ncbi:hypothetical protein AX15_007955 [Amanita polypyramis BW_CC]|nr:hypothetical protein AX15_007955 [Amanita polypyramis BW_CC]
MYANIVALLVLAACSATAQQPSIVCLPGQCLEGYTNITFGASLSGTGTPAQMHLLPGQYTSNTNPQLLHDVLTSLSATLSPSPGFNVPSSLTLPLNLQLQPGIAIFTESFYSGRSAFASLPTSPVNNNSVPLNAGSLALAPGVWAAVKAGSNRFVLWDSVPDVSQLPISITDVLSLSDLESSACSPSCSGSGICTVGGTCQCPQGFTGSSCESCAPGFFGPNCQPCPTGCTSCDDGVNGSGRCLRPIVNNPPSSCNCANGVCGSNGQCTCNPGFTEASNGTACAKCSTGFYLTSTGDCHVCQLGCSQCADSTGACTQCQQGFLLNPSDQTKCNPSQQTTSTGTVCPDGSFSNGNSCQPCDSSCQTCNGSTSNSCTSCAPGHYLSNGACVSADSNGVCIGSNLIADNNKHECDSCPAKCTSCKIPNFNVASTVNQLQCTGCLPGFFLSEGQCVPECPGGTFVSPQDNLTCTACDSSCTTCAGPSTFCLSCSGNALASIGKCVQTCPSNTFQSSGSCLTCHPDCATCSGGGFNQCSSCPSNRPVLVNGRCLPTCGKSQFFDTTTSSCQACDSSCSSCSAAGLGNCLACANTNSVLRSGSCTTASCANNSTVIPGLGVCLSDLAVVPHGSQTKSLPLPSVTGVNNPTTVAVGRPLSWWEILLMTLGCAFISFVIVWLLRRRAKKRRSKKTAMFAASKGLDKKQNWRWRLIRFGERFFGHSKSREGVIRLPTEHESETIKLAKLKAAEEARPSSDSGKYPLQDEDMANLSRSHRYSKAPSLRRSRYGSHFDRIYADDDRPISSHNAPSIYSQTTGTPRRGPDPRQPVRELPSRFSDTTLSSYEHHTNLPEKGSKNPFSQ